MALAAIIIVTFIVLVLVRFGLLLWYRRRERLQDFLFDAYAACGWPVDFYTKMAVCQHVSDCANNLTAKESKDLQRLEFVSNVWHHSPMSGNSAFSLYPPVLDSTEMVQ